MENGIWNKRLLQTTTKTISFSILDGETDTREMSQFVLIFYRETQRSFKMPLSAIYYDLLQALHKEDQVNQDFENSAQVKKLIDPIHYKNYSATIQSSYGCWGKLGHFSDKS